MGKSIQIRDVPDDVHAELRRQAADAGLSLSEFMLKEATRMAGRTHNAKVLLRVALRGDASLSRRDVLDGLDEARARRDRG